MRGLLERSFTFIFAGFLGISGIAVSSLSISCVRGGNSPLFLVDSIYAVANSIEDVRRFEFEGGGRATIRVVRDLGNPVPEMEEDLGRGFSRVLVSPYLADAAESLAAEYPKTFFGLIRYVGSGNERADNTVELILDRRESVMTLAERIADEVDPPGEEREQHILGVWRGVSGSDREELDLFRNTLEEASAGRFSVEIRAVGENPDLGDLEIFLREEIVANTVLGLCFAGPADVPCARVFWEYGIPVATEGLDGPGSVWGPVAYTVFHDIRTVLRSFRGISPDKNPSSILIPASIAPSRGANS